MNKLIETPSCPQESRRINVAGIFLNDPVIVRLVGSSHQLNHTSTKPVH